jgi:TonB family protein
MVGSGEGRALSSLAASQDLILEGGLDRAVIQATIAKYLSQVRACYEQGLAEKPGIQGTVSMSFQVGPAGQLDFAKVAKSSLGHEGVERCISKQMMGWKFPKPLGGVAVQVQYPFLLRPVGG